MRRDFSLGSNSFSAHGHRPPNSFLLQQVRTKLSIGLTIIHGLVVGKLTVQSKSSFLTPKQKWKFLHFFLVQLSPKNLTFPINLWGCLSLPTHFEKNFPRLFLSFAKNRVRMAPKQVFTGGGALKVPTHCRFQRPQLVGLKKFLVCWIFEIVWNGFEASVFISLSKL